MSHLIDKRLSDKRLTIFSRSTITDIFVFRQKKFREASNYRNILHLADKIVFFSMTYLFSNLEK